MKRLSRLLVRLYPREWQRRYGDEFSALLEDIPFRWSHAVDCTIGAVRMQIRSPLAILTLGLFAGLLATGVLVAARSEVYQSRADILVDGSDLRKIDATGHLVAFERVLEPMSKKERTRIGIEWRVAFADGTPIEAGQTLLRLTARDSSPAAAEHLTQRLVRRVVDISETARVLEGPSTGTLVNPEPPKGVIFRMVAEGGTQGLFVSYLWLLITSRRRRRWVDA